jgi:hypothetical protein
MVNKNEVAKAAERGLIPGRVREELDAGWQLLLLARRAAESAEFEQARQAVGYARQLFKRHSKWEGSFIGLAQCSLIVLLG